MNMNWKKIGFDCIKKAVSELNKLSQVKVLKDEINVQTNADIVSHNALIDCLKTHKVSCNIFSETIS